MEFGILALMIAALGYNVYGVLQVGVDNATTLQWVITIAMLVFVVMRIIRMMGARR